jgi:hypothetical protein
MVLFNEVSQVRKPIMFQYWGKENVTYLMGKEKKVPMLVLLRYMWTNGNG